MNYYILTVILLFSSVSPKPRYVDLDEDEQHLYRAAYETPSYDHDQYDEQDDSQVGRLDLIKDGMWIIKAKLKELKAFNKALAANLLSTKLKLKELIADHSLLKKHHHEVVEKKKPDYSYYEPSSYQQGANQHEHDPYYGY